MIKKFIDCGYGLATTWQYIVEHFILPSCEISGREETQPGKMWINYHDYHDYQRLSTTIYYGNEYNDFNDDQNPEYYKHSFEELPRLLNGGIYSHIYGGVYEDYECIDEYWSIKTSYGQYLDPKYYDYLQRAEDNDALVKFINELIFAVPFATLSSHQFTVEQQQISLLEFVVRCDENHDQKISKHLKHRLAQLVATNYCSYISQMTEKQVVSLAYLCIAQLPMLVVVLNNCRSSHRFFSEMESSMSKIGTSLIVSKTRRNALISYIEPQSVTRASTMQETDATLKKLQNIVTLLTACSENNPQFINTDWKTLQQGTMEGALPIIKSELVHGIKAEEMKIRQLEKEEAIISAKMNAPPAIFVKEVFNSKPVRNY